MYETLRAGRYVNLTATADVTTGGPSALIGFYVNSTNAGTLVLKDGGSSGTATPSLQPASLIQECNKGNDSASSG
jgi:hypothetical protein